MWWRNKKKASWTKDRMDALFRAFFWSNVLSSRYDQGFLTQMATDLNAMINLLESNKNEPDATWEKNAQSWIQTEIQQSLPTGSDIEGMLLLDGATGTVRLGLQLPVRYLPENDLLDPKQRVGYPIAPGTEVHHFFLKSG